MENDIFPGECRLTWKSWQSAYIGAGMVFFVVAIVSFSTGQVSVRALFLVLGAALSLLGSNVSRRLPKKGEPEPK